MTGKHNTTEQWYRDRAMTRSNAPADWDGFTPRRPRRMTGTQLYPQERQRIPVRQRHPLLRRLIEEMDRTTTQQELAKRAGVPVSTIRYLRAGRLTNPKLVTIEALAGALDLELVLRLK